MPRRVFPWTVACSADGVLEGARIIMIIISVIIVIIVMIVTIVI